MARLHHKHRSVHRSVHSSARWGLVALALVAATTTISCARQAPPPSEGGPIAMRRLTEDQYRRSIADIFGSDIRIVGRFEPDNRREGLLAVGTAWVSVTPAGFEQYETMARGIAAQVLDEKRRGQSVPCEPGSASKPDDACAAQFIQTVGRKVFRRPLEQSEIDSRTEIAGAAARTLGDFYGGLEYALASMLAAPEFLFRVEVAKPEPKNADGLRLDAFSKAARLSYFLWDTTPDEKLLAAAERGDLDTREGLEGQVERMLASPRLEAGVRAFFADLLAFDGIDELAKDSMIYPAFSAQIAVDAREQTLRVITDHLIAGQRDYRELFTTRRSFMTRALGLVYGVPVATRDGWEPVEFPVESQRAGLLTQVSFTALHSHPGRSSPTLRGMFVREAFLCQTIPPPPADVDFTMDENEVVLKTARERLQRHRTEPSCAGCHMLMDGIGLSLENFDGIGAYRTLEDGALIDTSGDLNGKQFRDAASLGEVLRDDPATSACVVDKLYKYAAGRTPEPGEERFLQYLKERFAANGHRFPDLLRLIVLSDAFYQVSTSHSSESPPAETPEGATVSAHSGADGFPNEDKS